MKPRRKTKVKEGLKLIQVGVQKRMIHIPGNPDKRVHTNLCLVPEEKSIKVTHLVLGREKEPEIEGKGQVQATLRIIRRTNMTLIIKKTLRVKK